MNQNAKGTRPTERKVLVLTEVLALDELVKEEYVKSAMGWEDFAGYVNASPHKSKFRFSLNGTHIRTAAEARNLTCNIAPSRNTSKGDVGAIFELLRAMEERLALVEKLVKVKENQ